MQDFDYWHKQEAGKPLFPDIQWNRPEQKIHAGKLAIIGGYPGGFAAVAENYETALKEGVGQVRAIIPDSLKKTIPVAIADTIFVTSNQSGGFSKEAERGFIAASEWADCLLLIGDAGRNSETAMLYERLLSQSTKPTVITRDAFDLLRNSMNSLVERDNTIFVLSFAQTQKLFQAVYYPKMLALSMQLTQLVEALHKFTISYPITIVTYHNEKIIVAHQGEMSTTPLASPLSMWRGKVATQAAAYIMWNESKPFQAITTSIV